MSKTKVYRVLSILLIFSFMQFIGLDGFGIKPESTYAAGVTSAQYLGENRTTKGNWIGVYGNEGYVLPFFTTTRTTSGRDNPLAGDLASLPSYVSGLTSKSTTYWVNSTPSTDIRTLQSPDARYSRKNMTVYGGTTFEYAFTITDDNEHMFTLYSTDFNNVETVTEKFEILDLSGKVLDSRTLSTINNGVYLSYKVKGSFKLRATKVAGYAAYTEGFFFDSIPQNTVSGVTVTYAVPRSANIAWTNSSTTNASSILRKMEGQSEYTEVAKVDCGTHTYTDQNLQAGRTYFYKVRSIENYKYSNTTEEVQITIPAYKNTVLEFMDAQLTAVKPGDRVTIRARLKDADGNLLQNRTLNFELQGQYVGTYIDKTIGSAVTNAAGEAMLTYSPPFAGDYTIQGEFPVDDENLINASQNILPLKVNLEKWEKAPAILRVSDGVSPDTLVSVNGYGMKSADMGQIAVKARLADGQYFAQPPEDAVELLIEQKDEQDGYFLVARLPAHVIPGQYDLWIHNEFGWSAPVKMNAPRPLFLSEREVFEGLDIKMAGRNFHSGEFGASTGTLVRLNNGSAGIYSVVIRELTPYSVTFPVENVPLGEYWVEISNDSGRNWSRLDNGQKLSLVTPGEDPLGLGVAWAKNFKWNHVYNVTDYGAVNHDTLDDTTAVQNAVNAANQSGGGIVYFPNGNYYVSKIDLPADIVLLGEDVTHTVLYHNGTTSANFIQSSDDGKVTGRQGIAKLSIRLSNPTYRPDTFLCLGQPWGNATKDVTLRTANEIFVYEVNIDYDLTSKGASGRGIGALIIGNERLLFEKNYMRGWFANLYRNYFNHYLSLKDNYFEFSEGVIVTTAGYAFVENNHLVGHPEYETDSHGLFSRNDVFMYKNIVEGMGSDKNNDGEALCAEVPSAYFNTGEVIGATSDDITIAPVAPLQNYTVMFSALTVAIIDGQGLGQYREVTGVNGNVLTIDRPWDIIPDKTSKFTLILPNKNITFYDNTIINCTKGIWFYGNAFDGVAADNKSIDSEGIYMFSSLVLSSARMTPSYFMQAKGNEITGVSRKSGHAGIYTNSQRSGVTGKYYAVNVYGIDIKDNIIVGNPAVQANPSTEAPPNNGIVSTAATYSSETITDTVAGDNTNIVIENNRLKNLNEGIVLSRADYGHVIKGIDFVENVQTPIRNLGTPQNVVVLNDSFADRRGPFWPAGSRLDVEKVDDTTFTLRWPLAEDGVGVNGYHIYIDNTLVRTVSSDVYSHTFTWMDSNYELPIKVEAFDSSNNQSLADLNTTITVAMNPDVMTTYLKNKTAGMGIENGIANSLASKLDNVIKSMGKRDKNSAVNQLKAFINEVNAQSGKKLTAEQAGELKALADKIVAAVLSWKDQ